MKIDNDRYALLNKIFFNDDLPQIPVERVCYGNLYGWYAYPLKKKSRGRKCRHRIVLNSKYSEYLLIFTLIHEMVHVDLCLNDRLYRNNQKGVHGVDFKHKYERIIAKIYSDKRIIDSGLFDSIFSVIDDNNPIGSLKQYMYRLFSNNDISACGFYTIMYMITKIDKCSD